MTAVRAPRRRASSDVQGGFDFSRPDEIVCGVDEAGRGPLAGPVVAAAARSTFVGFVPFVGFVGFTAFTAFSFAARLMLRSPGRGRARR